MLDLLREVGVVKKNGMLNLIIATALATGTWMGAQAELKDQVKGLWDFENLSLTASVGNNLAYAGNAAATTEFNTTTAFGIPNIGGTPANVMHFPAYRPRTDGIKVYPGIEANGGGYYVNLYTLIMDILFPAESNGIYRALFQTNDNNANDADLFVGDDFTGPDPDGIGTNYTYHGTLLPDTWYRIAFVVNCKATPPVIDKYVNGTFVGTSELLEGLDGTWSLYTATQGNPSWFFSDDTGEVGAGYVNSIAILDGTATADQILALGSATADGIFPVFSAPTPGPTPTATVTATPTPTPDPLSIPCHSGGVWEFDGDLHAAQGTDLKFVGDATATSSFGTTTSFGIPNIGGSAAYVMHFPAYPSTDGIQMFPGIEANGGGSYVNIYSLIMDVLYPEISNNTWRALFQTAASNNNDADFYVGDGGVTPSPNGIGISGSYHGTIAPNTWYRIGFAVDIPKLKMDKYIDGVYVGTTTLNEGVDYRWSLYTKTDNVPSWLFSDESGDTAEGYVNSVVITDCALLADDFANLGAADADGIGIINLRDDTGVEEWSQY